MQSGFLGQERQGPGSVQAWGVTPGMEGVPAGTGSAGQGGTLPVGTAGEPGPEYAGFWRRFAAWCIDWVLELIVAFVVLVLVFFAFFPESYEDPVLDAAVTDLVGSVVGLIVNWLYYAIFESSPKQATPGKMALGLIVTDLNGRRISFGRATGRYFAKFISALILCFGFAMIGFTRRKQGLHDMIADTLVLARR